MDSFEEQEEIKKQALQEITDRNSSSGTTVRLTAFEINKNAEQEDSNHTHEKSQMSEKKISRKGQVAQQGYLFSLYLSPVFLEAFTLNFFAEWGDKSQISTIFLAAKENAFLLVLLGALSGHLLCNTIAVLGGNFIGKIISTRTGK